MKLGFTFPGQGSQALGMLAGLAEVAAPVRETFDAASGVLGYDLWRLVQEGPAEALDETERTQPAMLAGGVAVWRTWRARGGPAPVCLAGHSLGEYTALVCGGALDFEPAVALVAERGRFMQEAVPAGGGAMAAVLGLDDEQVVRACAEVAGEEVVSAANFNAPGQVVIAGHAAAVRRAVERLREAGARRAVELAVSVPSHCALMEPAAERLRERLAQVEIRAPSLPVIHNVDAARHPDPASLREALARQLCSPVRWTETVRGMLGQGAGAIIECGPGRVLTGLCRRIERDAEALAIGEPAALEQALQREAG